MKPSVTFSDYLEAEQRSDPKHEWLPDDCEVYSSAAMLYVADAKLSTYADAIVVCGPLETITVKRNGRPLGEAVTNPLVIVEVLSESTERYDREEKFGYYRTLPSLQEYVLVSQDEQAIEVYRRPSSSSPRRASPPPSPELPESRDRWDCERAVAGGSVTIHGCTIAVDAVHGERA